MLTTDPRLYIRRPSPTTAEFTVTTCPPLTFPLRVLLLLLHLVRLLLLSAAVLTLYSRFLLPASTTQNTTTTTTTTNTTNTNLANTPPNTTRATDHVLTAPATSAQGDPLLTALNNTIPTALHIVLLTAHLSPAGAALARAASALPDWAAALIALGTMYAAACCFALHRTESVLVLRGLGIQTCTSGSGSGYQYESGSGWLGLWGSGWRPRKTRFIPTEKIRDVLINEAFRGFEVRYYLIVVVEGEEEVVVLFPGLLPRRRIVEAVWRGVRGCLFEGGQGREGGVEKG